MCWQLLNMNCPLTTSPVCFVLCCLAWSTNLGWWNCIGCRIEDEERPLFFFTSGWLALSEWDAPVCWERWECFASGLPLSSLSCSLSLSLLSPACSRSCALSAPSLSFHFLEVHPPCWGPSTGTDFQHRIICAPWRLGVRPSLENTKALGSDPHWETQRPCVCTWLCNIYQEPSIFSGFMQIEEKPSLEGLLMAVGSTVHSEHNCWVPYIEGKWNFKFNIR